LRSEPEHRGHHGAHPAPLVEPLGGVVADEHVQQDVRRAGLGQTLLGCVQQEAAQPTAALARTASDSISPMRAPVGQDRSRSMTGRPAAPTSRW
jgi:hypothetical protein